MPDQNSLELVYDVIRDLIESFEEAWSKGALEGQSIEVLSACYSVCDYAANKLAEFASEDDAERDRPLITASQYADALATMKECEQLLTANLADDDCPSFIDYRKVQSLAGFQVVIPYVESIIRVLED